MSDSTGMAGGGWSSQRVETAHREARAVLEAQQETVADIDDKAMRTVRLTVVLLGVLVSAVELADHAFRSRLLSVGLALLVASLVIGVLTYSESTLYLGPNKSYLNQLRQARFAASGRGDRLERYSRMIAASSPSHLYTDQSDVGGEYRDERRTTAWEQDLLATYADWIDDNSTDVRRNGQLLLATQLSLVGGVVCAAAAVVF